MPDPVFHVGHRYTELPSSLEDKHWGFPFVKDFIWGLPTGCVLSQ